MHLIRLMTVFTLMFAASAYGQIQSVDPSASSNVATAASEPAAKSDAHTPALIMDSSRGQNDADARECLQFGSNGEIHRCAEKYRSHSGVKIVKTGQKSGRAKGSDASDASNSARNPQAPSPQAVDTTTAAVTVSAKGSK